MNDTETPIKDIKKLLRTFVEERQWEEYHTPKDLSIAVATEAAEIMEHFRFRNGKRLETYLKDEESRRELSHELADVFSFLVRLADVLDIDLAHALEEKLALNRERYPAEKVKGKWMYKK